MNAAAQALIRMLWYRHVIPLFHYLYWLPLSAMQCLFIIYKTLLHYGISFLRDAFWVTAAPQCHLLGPRNMSSLMQCLLSGIIFPQRSPPQCCFRSLAVVPALRPSVYEVLLLVGGFVCEDIEDMVIWLSQILYFYFHFLIISCAIHSLYTQVVSKAKQHHHHHVY